MRYTLHSLLRCFAILFLCLFVMCALAAADGSTIDWGKASALEIHRYLVDGKIRANFDRKFLEVLAAQEGEENTQGNYDVTSYDVYIRVNDTTEILYGHVGFDVDIAEDAVNQLQVDLWSNMVVDSVIGPSGALSSTRSGNYVYVSLNRSYSIGEKAGFTIYYHGHPVEEGLPAFAFGARNGYRVISSLSEPYFARTWWPCKDLMIDKPDSMKIAIEVDTTFYVGSNGTLDSVTAASSNSHTFYYSERYPIATYLFFVDISVYTVWHDWFVYNGGADSMLITNAAFPDQVEYAMPGWSITAHALQIFTDVYGPYPFLGEKFGHINSLTPAFMENQTMTSMGAVSSLRGYSGMEPHELSHQWWGDMITCASWQDVWLNEGWATYSEAVYSLADSGWGAYRLHMRLLDYYNTGGTIYCSDTTSIDNIFTYLTYDKAAWALHMLRGVLGEEKWALAVDAYYHSEFQYGAATTEDFKNVVQQASGMELDWFFNEWIHGEYRPNYYYYYASRPSDSGGYDVFLVIKQTQTTSPAVFTMPVQLRVDHPSQPSDTVVVFDDQRQKLFRFNFDSDVSNIAFDPDGWILKYESAQPWEMFIITFADDLRGGFVDSTYADTVEIIGTGDFVYEITQGSLPPGLTIDSGGVISGIPTDTGLFEFGVAVTDYSTGVMDSGSFRISIVHAPCCGRYTGGLTGNTDCDPEGHMNLLDITALIDRVYLSKHPLCQAIYGYFGCDAEGNTDGSPDGKVNLIDIAKLIDRVYLSKGETAPCM